MVKQRSMAPEMEDEAEREDPSSQFLDSLRTRAMDDLHAAALEYGIVLKDLGMTSNISSVYALTNVLRSGHRSPVQGRHRGDHGEAYNPCSASASRGCER